MHEQTNPVTFYHMKVGMSSYRPKFIHFFWVFYSKEIKIFLRKTFSCVPKRDAVKQKSDAAASDLSEAEKGDSWIAIKKAYQNRLPLPRRGKAADQRKVG